MYVDQLNISEMAIYLNFTLAIKTWPAMVRLIPGMEGACAWLDGTRLRTSLKIAEMVKIIKEKVFLYLYFQGMIIAVLLCEQTKQKLETCILSTNSRTSSN